MTMSSRSIRTERRALQIAVALAACVPVFAGGWGVVRAVHFLELARNVSADSHVRYLSGLLLGIGLAFWLMVPRIERHASRFSLLTAIVVIGGLARLLGLVLTGVPSFAMLFGLVMELVVTPLLWGWQQRVARRCSQS